MKDLIKNKYFYIGLIVSAFAVLGISAITFNLLDKVEPSLDNYVDGAYISKSKKSLPKQSTKFLNLVSSLIKL